MEHPIDAYCERHDISLSEFAAGISIKLSSLWRIRTGERRASSGLLGEISRFTGGEVTANDILDAPVLPIRHRYYTSEAKRKCSEGVVRPHGTPAPLGEEAA